VPQVQYSDRVVDVPVVQQRQVPSVQKAQKTGELPQVHHSGGAGIGKGGDVPGQFHHDLEGGGASLLGGAGIGKGAFPEELIERTVEVSVPPFFHTI